MSSKVVFCSLQSLKFRGATDMRWPSWVSASQMATSRSGSSKGNGFSRTPSTRLKIAVSAPIPNARVRTAAAVNPECLARIRNPYRMS